MKTTRSPANDGPAPVRVSRRGGAPGRRSITLPSLSAVTRAPSARTSSHTTGSGTGYRATSAPVRQFSTMTAADVP